MDSTDSGEIIALRCAFETDRGAGARADRTTGRQGYQWLGGYARIPASTREIEAGNSNLILLLVAVRSLEYSSETSADAGSCWRETDSRTKSRAVKLTPFRTSFHRGADGGCG
jgi:hypothetical protein